MFCLVFTAPAKWRVELRAKIGHYRNRCLTTYIWQVISLYFNFEITWKIIVLGFYNEVNSKTIRLNNIISFVCYKIYKYKMKCRLLQENMCGFNLVKMLKYELKKQNSVLKSTGKLKDDLYNNLSDVL